MSTDVDNTLTETILRDIQRRLGNIELVVRTHDARFDLVERRITHLGDDLADVLTRRLIAFEELIEARFAGTDKTLEKIIALLEKGENRV